MIAALAYLIIAAGLALAVWGGAAAALNRPPTRALYIGAGVVAVLVAVQAIIAEIRLLGGADVRTGLFVGYLVAAIVLIPVAGLLARLEPTRWGSAILGAAGLVLAPLVLRLVQIWGQGG